MKGRSTVVYLVVLLLLGGYFYYFEVVKKEQKEAAEQESGQVFSFQSDAVQALEIQAGDAPPIRLEREDGWKIVAPIRTDVDKTAFDGFFPALRKLRTERRISPVPENLSGFGLDHPPLKIRIQTGGEWTELWVGEKNPAGDSRYARLAARPDVFLIAQGNWDVLNKSLKDLRKKEIFSFQPEDVVSMQVAWQNGDTVTVERQGGPGAREWKGTDAPDLKIKPRKVENVIDQIHWLRAVDFLPEDSAVEPRVLVKLGLADGRSVELRIGDQDKKTKQAPAKSSEYALPVMVSANIFNDIPNSPAALADRSLLSGEPEDVRELRWTRGESKGDVVKIDEKTWGVKEGEAPPKPLKESFRAQSLVWEIGDAEFDTKVEPRPELPKSWHAEVELLAGGGKPATLAWEKLPPAGKEPAVLWMGTGEDRVAVQIKSDTLHRIEDALDQLAAAAQQKE